MSATTTDAPPARLKARYFEEIRPALIERFELLLGDAGAALEKITLNMGVGLAKQDSKVLKAATEQLATIAGQQPSVRRARKSIAAFKLREGMPVGVAVTLRGERAYEFLDRLVSVAIPRIRDFRGLNPRSFDGRGNYSMGVSEQIIFPEIDYDAIDQVRGLDITITTSASSDLEAFALLQALGMPFATQGRPRGFDPAADAPPRPTDAERARGRRQASRRPRRRGRSRARDAEPRSRRSRRAGGRRRAPRPRPRRPTAEEPEAEAGPAARAEAAASPRRTADEPEPRQRTPRRSAEAARADATETSRGREREHRLMAKTSQRVKQTRTPKFKTRAYTRCSRCGRPRAVYRKFGVCRICLRELAHNGQIPGMTKSSW